MRELCCAVGVFTVALGLMDWLQQTSHSLEGSYFYSDSHNDLPLLQVVDNPVAVDPDPILHAHAQAENWLVLRLHSSGSLVSASQLPL